MQLDDELRGMLTRASKVQHPKAKLSLQLHPVQLRLWADDDGIAIRPWYVIVLELYPRGKVVNQYLGRPVSKKPDAKQILRALLNHILEPPDGERMRPAHVSVVDKDVHRALASVLPKAFTKFECTTLADGLDEYVSAFSEKLVIADKGTRADGAERAGILNNGLVGVKQAGEMVTSACSMWRMAPWKRIHDTLALRAVLPAGKFRTDTYYISVLGGSEDSVQGFALMPSLSALRAKYRRHNKAKHASIVDYDEIDEVGNTNGDVNKKKKPEIDLDKLVCGFCGRCVASDGQRARKTGRNDDDDDMSVYVNRCGGCKRLMYCDERCQRADWRLRHRNECEAARNDENYVFKRPEWAWLSRELALLFVDPTAVPFDDLDAFELYGWPLIDSTQPPMYPFSFVTVIQENALQPKVERPNAREVEVLTMISRALVECTAPPPEDTTLHLKNGVSLSVCEDLKISCATSEQK